MGIITDFKKQNKPKMNLANSLENLEQENLPYINPFIRSTSISHSKSKKQTPEVKKRNSTGPRKKLTKNFLNWSENHTQDKVLSYLHESDIVAEYQNQANSSQNQSNHKNFNNNNKNNNNNESLNLHSFLQTKNIKIEDDFVNNNNEYDNNY